jgi:hypothetical protein
MALILPNRRQLITGGAAGLAALGLPRPALASVAASDLKFLFVYCYGGWDPTRTFATVFDNRMVDMERDAVPGELGDLSFVDHEDRPSVRGFFERYGDRTCIVNGMLVPSVAHENCLKLSLTGSSADGRSDWPAILAGTQLSGFSLPHLVVQGPSFPGEMGSAVTRAGTSGQLEGLLSGDILDKSELVTRAPSRRAEDVMDRYLSNRASAAADYAAAGREAQLLQAYDSALDRGTSLKDLLHVLEWSSSSDLGSQAEMAVSALSLGISRCCTMSFSSYSWDSHVNNDLYQGSNFELLFSGLADLMDRLSATPGHASDSLADETVLVVMSEMGRTPQLNDAGGKDHWPYTSMMAVGPGLRPGVVGAFDSYYQGELVDFESGEVWRDGRELSSVAVGCTLLALAGIDHREFHPGVDHVAGMLL